MANPEHHIISGTAYESDGSTILDSEEVYIVNVTDEKYLGKTTTSSVGQYIFDLANFDGDWSNGDTVRVFSNKLFARYVISSLTPATTSEYRFTIDVELSDETTGRGIWTTAGMNEVRDWLGGETATTLSHCAWGTGETNPDATDTTLEGEQDRNAITTRTRDNHVVSVMSVLAGSEANGNDLYKTGLFNASSSGTLFTEQKTGKTSKTDKFQVQTFDTLEVI